MSIPIPDEPDRYFREFFPERFRAHRTHFPSGDTAAATRFRLEGAGTWCLRVAGDELVVTEDADDVALELACTVDDFRSLFVGHLRDEVARHGALSPGSLSALRPVVLTDRKRAICQRTRRTLALVLVQRRAPRRLLVTPGGGAATEPACIVKLSFDDYLRVQQGQRSTKMLFVLRKLKVGGDIGHALRLDPLLG